MKDEEDNLFYITADERDRSVYYLFKKLSDNDFEQLGTSSNPLKLEEKSDYANIINILNDIVKDKVDVFAYNTENESNNNIKIMNIESKYKYGILSKYMGYITAKKQKSLIVLPYELLKIDLNIFNNRYINENVKIVVNKEKGQTNNIEEWIKDNNIEILQTKKLDKNIFKNFWNLDKTNVLIVEEEK